MPASKGPCWESTRLRCNKSALLASRITGGILAAPVRTTSWCSWSIKSKLRRSVTEYTSTTASAHWMEQVTWSGMLIPLSVIWGGKKGRMIKSLSWRRFLQHFFFRLNFKLRLNQFKCRLTFCNLTSVMNGTLTEADKSYKITSAEQRGVGDWEVWIWTRVSFTLAPDSH